MSSGRTAAGAAERVGSGAGRVLRVWRGLPHERRLAAGSAIGLFVTLFLPWYQETVIAPGTTDLRSASVTLTGWGAFSFVEAAVLVVAAGVLTLLFVRAEGRAFHVPGGDGGVITAAGFWTCVLIIWRIFDKQGTDSHAQFATSSGIEWGIFFALIVAAVMTYAGTRIRAAHQPEPPLPGEEPLLKREDAGEPASRRAWTPRPVAASAPRRGRADAPPRSRADDPTQAPADAPPRSRADDPTQARAKAPLPAQANSAPQAPAGGAPQARAEEPTRPTRRRRPVSESPQHGPQAAAAQGSGQPAPAPQPTKRRRSDGKRPEPVAADDPPTRRLTPGESRTQPLGAGHDDSPRRTQPQEPDPDPDDARERPRPPRPGRQDAPRRALPLDPGPDDADWEIGEFRTRRLTREDRGQDPPEHPDDQLTIPLDHDD
jgi:hypothetical protein